MNRTGSKEKKEIKGWVHALVLPMLLAAFVLTGCGGKVGRIAKAIRIDDAIILTTEGFDGAGKLNVTPDDEALARMVLEANADVTDAQLTEFIKALEILPSEKENLSNGQEITLSVNAPSALMEQMGIVLAEDTWTYQITDLKEVEEIDPFAYVETEITGISPELKLALKTKWVNDEVGSLQYLVNGNNIGGGTLDKVAIGDTIILTVADEESTLLAKGVRLGTTEKTITIEDIYDKWVLSTEDLEDDVLETLKEKAKEHVALYLQTFENDMIITEPKYEGAICGKSKDPSYYYDGVYLIYSFVCSNPTEEAQKEISLEKDFFDKTVYFPVWFRYVKRYADGATSYEKILSTSEMESRLGYFSNGNGYLYGYTDASEMFNRQIRDYKQYYDWTFTDDIKALYDEG